MSPTDENSDYFVELHASYVRACAGCTYQFSAHAVCVARAGVTGDYW